MRFNFLSRQHISHESKKSIKFVVKDRWLNKMVNISRDNYGKLLVLIEKVKYRLTIDMVIYRDAKQINYKSLKTISIIFKLNSP